MSYEEFLEKVRLHVKKYLPNEYAETEPEIFERSLNNGVNYCGLVVRRPDRNIAPILNLEPYYQMHGQGVNLDIVITKIAASYYKRDVESPIINVKEFNYESVKDKILVEICNAEMNRKELANVPHELKEDLALRYYVRYEYSDQEIGTVRICNNHLKLWNISQEELKKQAWKNMKCFSKPSLQSLKQIAREWFDTVDEDMRSDAREVYVLTSENQKHGAAYIFDDFVMQSIAKILDDDLLILPSSVDEVLLIKRNSDEGQISIAELKEMVEHVNGNYLVPEEILSNEVYLYEKDTRQLSIAIDGEQQLGMSMNM